MNEGENNFIFLYIYVHSISHRCTTDVTFIFDWSKQHFKKRAQRVSKILFLTRENKIHIFKPPCNYRFIV